jgi:hypothetical protein
MTMPNPAKAPELKPPAGYVLVTKGVVQEGDYCLNRIGPYPDDLEWQRFDSGADLIGMPASHWAAVVRPPQPEPSEREPVGSIGSLETLAKDYARKWRAAEERKRELEKTLDSILRMCWHYKTESKAKLRLTMQGVYEAARKALEREGEE